LLASAQLPIGLAAGLLVNGTQAAAKATRNRAGKPGEFVTYFRVGADSVAMKRTPDDKIRGDAAAYIRTLEQRLASTNERYRMGIEELCPNAVVYQTYLQYIRTNQPKWETAAYEQELAFYQQEHQRRYQAARHKEQQAQEAATRRWRARQDSVARAERRRWQQQDSLRAMAYARRQAYNDSVTAVADRIAARQMAAADSLARSMRAAAATTAPRTSSPTSRPAVARRPATAARPAVARPAPRPAGGGVVYMCDSGNRVKYHASPGCRGLNRCGASVVRLSKAEAQQSMDPCKFCY
jgi:hypothetical protein